MPKVTLYIREDDYDKWKFIKNKSELVSQAINQKVSTPPTMEYIEETGFVKTEDLKNITIPEGVTVQSTPKNNSEGKPSKRNICPEHLVDKDTCKLMKHKA